MQKIFCLLMITLCFAGCKKALEVKEDMYFEQVNWANPYAGDERDPVIEIAPMKLALKANGYATLYPGNGDIIYSGTYQVKRKQVKVKIGTAYYEFKIKSATELVGPGGEALLLKE